MSLDTTGYERKTKRTRKRKFLDKINLVVPWSKLVPLIALCAPARSTKGGRPTFAVQTMLRIHFLQPSLNLFALAAEEALQVSSAKFSDNRLVLAKAFLK